MARLEATFIERVRMPYLYRKVGMRASRTATVVIEGRLVIRHQGWVTAVRHPLHIFHRRTTALGRVLETAPKCAHGLRGLRT